MKYQMTPFNNNKRKSFMFRCFSSVFKKLKSLDQPSETFPSKETASSEVAATPSPSTNTKTKPQASAVKQSLDQYITNASSVSELLQLSERKLNQQYAMSILTKLSVWTASNQVNVKDFENDYRFLKICRILSKEPVKNDLKKVVRNYEQKSAELEMVLSIAGDDEALKIIETLSLSQNVKVFSSFARKKTRSLEVLKALAANISAHPDKMNLKECSDLLFAMTTLNFIDEMLLCRIGIDINAALEKNVDKVAVVGSIVTSLGFLKYNEPTLLENLTKWVIDKQELCRTKDLASLVITLALVNYVPNNVNDLTAKIISKISRDDLSANEWLDYVWALSMLELQQSLHLESVLRLVQKKKQNYFHFVSN